MTVELLFLHFFLCRSDVLLLRIELINNTKGKKKRDVFQQEPPLCQTSQGLSPRTLKERKE